MDKKRGLEQDIMRSDSPDPRVVEEMGDMVTRLVRVCQLFERDQITVHGVTTSQCHCLLELEKEDGQSMQEISQRLNLKTSTVTRIAGLLVRDGYLVRNLDALDRRCVCLQLTDKGREKALQLKESIRAYYAKMVRNIPDGRMDAIRQAVLELQSAFEAANPNCC